MNGQRVKDHFWLLSESEMEFRLFEQQRMAQLLHRNPSTVMKSPPPMIITSKYHKSFPSIFSTFPSLSLPSLDCGGGIGCPGATVDEDIFLPNSDLSSAIMYRITRPVPMISIPQIMQRVEAQKHALDFSFMVFDLMS